MKTRIFNLIILDQSGSMHAIKQAAIGSVNETFQTIRQAQDKYLEQEHFVTFVTFNTESINTIYDCVSVNEIHEIDEKVYQPNGGTPLYDAMGFSITKLRSYVAESDKVLVTIVTDGMENASTEYNSKTIRLLVEELKTQNWVFVYMGANHDVESFAEHLSIHNHLLFQADNEGMAECTTQQTLGRQRYYERVNFCCCSESAPDMDEDNIFFKQD